MASTLVITSSNKIERRFATLRESGRKALVCYATAGFPDILRSSEVLQVMEDAGADVVEVGVPFSDPMADGPVIQLSSRKALEGGMTLDRTLELIAKTRLEIPVVLFSYLNPLLAAGGDVVERSRDAGVDGILVTDLPVGADAELESRFGSVDGVAFIRLVAPTTPVERMREIGRHGSGFVYLISRRGVTGTRGDIPADLPETAARLRSVTHLPVCAGFGIAGPAHARTVAAVADGVVVGSALVRAAAEDIRAVGALTRSLREALDA